MPSDYQQVREQRQEWRAAGLCGDCGGPVVPGYARCERHKALLDARNKRAKANRERHNLCYCGKPRAPKRKRCPECLEIERLKREATIAERIDAGLCIWCGTRQATGGTQACGPCRRSRKARYDDKRVGQIRKRLRELIDRNRVPLPKRMLQMARFLLGAMVEVESAPNSAHWRPTEEACRRYAADHPEFEGFVLVASRTKNITSYRVFLMTRNRSEQWGRERIDLVHIPTSTEVPWRQYG
jgi:hypothetical protein